MTSYVNSKNNFKLAKSAFFSVKQATTLSLFVFQANLVKPGYLHSMVWQVSFYHIETSFGMALILQGRYDFTGIDRKIFGVNTLSSIISKGLVHR